MPDRDDIRRLALALPEGYEADHHGIPSFRVAKKIYCTVHLDRPRIVLKLDRDDQLNLIAALPGLVEEAEWYPQHGWTYAWFEKTDLQTLELLLKLAWANVAPKRLSKAFSSGA
jgi:hypothetical protein